MTQAKNPSQKQEKQNQDNAQSKQEPDEASQTAVHAKAPEDMSEASSTDTQSQKQSQSKSQTQQQTISHADIVGWGIDKIPEKRPGHPLEQEQERAISFDTLMDKPPYTVTIPLRGLSGVIRKLAYSAPDWKVRRWFLLMLGDRIDVIESRAMEWRQMLMGKMNQQLRSNASHPPEVQSTNTTN